MAFMQMIHQNLRFIDSPVFKILFYNLLFAIAIIFAFCPQCFTSWSNFFSVLDDILYSYTLCLGLGLGNGFINDYLSEKINWLEKPVTRLVSGIFLQFLYSGLFTLVTHFIYVVIFHGMSLNYYRSLDNIWTILELPLLITIIITSILTSRSFLLNWRQEAINAEKYKNENLASQFSALKSQVNPHFLFNSLNALTSLVYQDPDGAARFIRQLSDVYRYVLENQEKEVVPLTKELVFIEAYLSMQKIRYGSNLEVTINVPVNEKIFIAPLSLQLLIENAIKHNIISEDEPLHIDIFLENEEYIVVKNNLQAKKTPEASSGTGLNNIRARYGILTDKVVDIVKSATNFTVKLPVLFFKEL